MVKLFSLIENHDELRDRDPESEVSIATAAGLVYWALPICSFVLCYTLRRSGFLALSLTPSYVIVV